jgi:hypothetical protein
VKFAFIDVKRVAFPIGPMCRVMGSGYYAWKKRPAPPKTKAAALLRRRGCRCPQGAEGHTAARGFTPS